MTEARSLRLLVVGVKWPPETFLGRILKGLSRDGMQVTVELGTRPDAESLRRSGLRSLRVRHWAGSRLLRILRIARLTIRALVVAPRQLGVLLQRAKSARGTTERLRLLNRILPFLGRDWDVLYFPWSSAAVNYLPLFDLGKPVLLSCRGSQINVVPHDPRRHQKPGLALVFRRAARVHCVSRAMEGEAAALGLDRSKSRVVYTGVDAEFFRPDDGARDGGSAARPLDIVTVTRLVWVKGLRYALAAVRMLLDAGVPARFSLIGEGPEVQRTLYTIQDLGIENQVTLLGRRPVEEVRERLRRADVFVLPSLSEGFCNAAIEAMACGLPVVLTDSGGSPEAIRDGVEGFLVPPRDPAAMAQALEKLAADAPLRRRMGEAGRQRVLQDFTTARQVREFSALVEETRACPAG